jgi:hypothetical protein
VGPKSGLGYVEKNKKFCGKLIVFGLASNDRLFWHQYSGFQSSCDIAPFSRLLFQSHLFLLLLLPPHCPVLTHWECVVCMVLCDALYMVTYLNTEYLKC